MQKIINWTAKRAGGRITINGVTADTLQPIKLVGVDEIKAFVGLAIATKSDGTKYELEA